MSLTIKTYLKKAASHQLYSEGLALFRKHGSVLYPSILRQLEKGYFGSNKQTMLHYLQKIAAQVDDQPIQHKEKKIIVHEAKTPNPKTMPSGKTRKIVRPGESSSNYYALLKEIRNAIHVRMQISQTLHDCMNQADGIIVVEKIEEQGKVIKALQAKKEYYEKHGEMPEVEEITDFELADTFEGLQKQLKIVRDRVRNAEKGIQHKSTQLEKGENFKIRAKLIKQEAYRKELLEQGLIIKAELNEHKTRRKQRASKGA